MFLATTSLQEFWQEKDIIYLGQWCLFPDHIKLWKDEKSKVLKCPWSNPAYYKDKVKYCEFLSEEILTKFGNIFNKHFKKDYSIKYWKILFGQWITVYTGQYLNRYVCLKEALSKFKDIDTIVLQNDVDVHNVNPAYKLDLLELKKYSTILSTLGYDFPQKDIPFEWRLNPVISNTPYVRSLTRFIRSDSKIICGWMLYDKDRIEDILEGTGLKYDNIGYYDFTTVLPQFKKDNSHSLRIAIKEINSKNEFEKILIKEIAIDFPENFIEGYNYFDKIANKNLTIQQSYILSAIGCQESVLFKFIAATSYEKGAKIILTQHGSMYGTYQYVPGKKFETEIADLYLSWGWGSNRDKKFKNISSLASNDIVKNNVGADKILYLSNQFSKYFSDFRSAIKCFGSDRYFENVSEFFGALPAALYKSIIFRSKGGIPTSISQHLKEQFEGIAFDNRDLPIKERFAVSKLAVCDCFTQVYIDALQNLPTILFWDESIWRANTVARKYLKELKKVGVLFDSPLLAANQIEKIWDDPQIWWQRNDVQYAIYSFLNKFSKPNVDYKHEWSRQLKKICT